MQYISTRGGVKPLSFQQVVLMGLADDGGLLIPESLPDVRDKLDSWRKLDYLQLAHEVFSLFATDVPNGILEQLVGRSYGNTFKPEVAPTVQVGDLFILELFHGPTLSFKDMALQFLGNLYEYILGETGGHLNILGATSGDTGSAAIYGVRGRERINIFIMHPHKRVSDIQERQMTSVLDANVHNIAVRGSFDDCQRIMKSLAGDLDFKRRYCIGSVNSINFARILAQIVYYFYSAFRVQEMTGTDQIRFCVPTGNFGDILAGWYAKRMGLNLSRLILATNENDILARFFNTGVYSRGTVAQTYSPAMDIQVSSNFERYLYHRVGDDPRRLRTLMEVFAETGALKIELAEGEVVASEMVSKSASNEETLETIGKYYRDYGYILDPHTAVGVHVAEDFGLDGEPLICVSTAHPAKFPEAIHKATGKDVARHPDIDALADLPTRCEILDNDSQVVRAFIEKTLMVS